jgi:hypothetical protein
VIFTAAMSSSPGEINSPAAVTIIDLYQRHIRKDASDRHYLTASRLATVFWGAYAVVFAQYGSNFGALIEAVNIIGSLFYGGLLGVFVLAFFFRSVGANGAFFELWPGSRYLCRLSVHQNLVPVVQRGGLRCGDRRRRAVSQSSPRESNGRPWHDPSSGFCSVDFSVQCKTIMPFVRAMAKCFDSEIVLLHVVDIPVHGTGQQKPGANHVALLTTRRSTRPLRRRGVFRCTREPSRDERGGRTANR